MPKAAGKRHRPGASTLPTMSFFRRSTTAATSGMAAIIITRTVCSGMVCSSTAPSQLPGNAPSAASSATRISTRCPARNRPEAATVPRQADSLLVPAATTGDNPAR